MPPFLRQLGLAVVVGVAVGLIALFLGTVLNSLAVPPATAVGGFLIQWCWVLGILAGVWYFFRGSLPGASA